MAHNQYQGYSRLADQHGAVSGGTGFLKMDAAFNVQNFGTSDCPCVIAFFLYVDGGANSHINYVTLLDNVFSYVRSAAGGAATMAYPVPSGNLPKYVRLNAFIHQAEDIVNFEENKISAKGNITAIWAPFGATGGNTLSAASAEQDEAPQGTEPDGKPDTER
jgi:hypothetical protein